MIARKEDAPTRGVWLLTAAAQPAWCSRLMRRGHQHTLGAAPLGNSPTPRLLCVRRYNGSAIETFPGNRVLAPFKLIQWTKGGNSNDANYTVSATPLGWASGEFQAAWGFENEDGQGHVARRAASAPQACLTAAASRAVLLAGSVCVQVPVPGLRNLWRCGIRTFLAPLCSLLLDR